VTGIFVAGGVPILALDDATLARNLGTQALPVVLVALGMGTATMYLLWRDHLRAARLTAIAAVASVVAGWGIGQYPWLIIDQLTIDEAAGAQSSIVALLIASGVAGVLVGPPLVYLFMLADQNRVGTALPGSIRQPDDAT
jgi:cytochrome d ubiquinol oxidase subunit II